MSERQTFWMVYGEGQSAPTWKHRSEINAISEPERLANIHPGKTFVVLEAIGAVRKREVERINIGRGFSPDIDDDIPF